MAHKATIGTVSHGTMRAVDLIVSFADTLEYLGDLSASELELVAEARAWLARSDSDSDDGDEILNGLFDTLDERAPTCCYFGANEGDGSDYGFWPCLDALDQYARVDDPADVENHVGDCCYFVNDHGNVTFYDESSSIAWDCV